MKVLLISMPDVSPIFIHEMAVHMPNHGIACIGGNIDNRHDVALIDLVRKRGNIARYLRKTIKKIDPDLVGLSAMTWQYETCLALIRLIKEILPDCRIAIGGYHATSISGEIAAASESDLIDFMIRGEGEETFRRLVKALDSEDRLEAIPGLSFKQVGKWIHNDPAPLCDLSRLKLPIRDRRRLTSGYHLMFKRIEVLETSRGCTRDCNFCSIRNMYGRSYRTYPVERIIADLDDIYFNKKTRLVFIADDNMVLNPNWVMEVCDAVIRKNYGHLELAVQAECNAMAKNEAMVAKMAQAGFRVIFLGIESVSEQNLRMVHKADVFKTSRQAIDNCHRHGMMVIGGLIFGLPDDDEEAIKRNYQYLSDLEVDASYCQMLSPFPGTVLREQLSREGLITNHDRYEHYNGLWANVKTRRMEADQLQYAFWYHRQVTLGWWKPSSLIRRKGKVWTSIWTHAAKPLMTFFVNRRLRKQGWEERYRQYIDRLDRMNRFEDLKPYERKREELIPELRVTGRI